MSVIEKYMAAKHEHKEMKQQEYSVQIHAETNNDGSISIKIRNKSGRLTPRFSRFLAQSINTSFNVIKQNVFDLSKTDLSGDKAKAKELARKIIKEKVDNE